LTYMTLEKGSPAWIEWRNKISESKKGKHYTTEHVEKIRASKLGHFVSDETKAKMSAAHKGRVLSKEWRAKIAMSLLGEKSKLWKGGKSFEPYCQKFNNEFKERVRAFFGYQCVECGRKTNYKLHVHHVNYEKDACCDDSIKPLFVALCRSCHAKTNNDREYWRLHFTTVINEKFGGECYYHKVDSKKGL
jgi:hypothetical protein